MKFLGILFLLFLPFLGIGQTTYEIHKWYPAEFVGYTPARFKHPEGYTFRLNKTKEYITLSGGHVRIIKNMTCSSWYLMPIEKNLLSLTERGARGFSWYAEKW